MKQNQSILYFVPEAKPKLKHHDFLTLKSHCTCEECSRITETHNPEIRLDNELYALQRNVHKNKKNCDYVQFLQKLKNSKKNLPKFRFLDTIVVEGGEAAYAIFFEDGKLKIDTQVKLKQWILQRKQSRDIKYQIKKHQRQNNFNFTAFQHDCEKKIKEFQNNILYKIPAVLNKTAYIKLKHEPKEILLSKNEFIDLFDSGKIRLFDLKDLEYVQVFPIMYGQEENSYLKTIKYFRQKQSLKRSFKLAEAYVSIWKQRNDSLQKMQEKVYQEIKNQQNLQEVTEEDKLCYQTYKLLIYFEQVTNIRILEAVLQYVTNDNGASYFFKTIDCIKTEKRASVEELGTELPTKKEIDQQDYIDLKKEMRGIFDSFQSQFHRLDKERQQMQNKTKKDKQFSNFVFKTICAKKSDNFHEVLQSQKLKYKKKQLNL